MSGLSLLIAAGSGWLLGTALQLQQAELGAPGLRLVLLLAGLLVGAGTVALFARQRGRSVGRMWPWALGIAALVVGGAFGWSLTDWRAAQRLGSQLSPALEGEDLQVVGIVTGLPVRRADGIRFRFEIESASHRGQALAIGPACPSTVSVGWYLDPDDAASGAWPAASQPRAGQRWRFTLRLRRPHGTLNPHGFDFELWMFEQNLRATGYVRAAATMREQDRPQMLGERVGAPIEQMRQHWRDAIWREVGDRPAAGVLAALAVGDQAAIERGDWDVFRATGVAHLVAISGLHVTLFAWLAGHVIGSLWRRSAGASLWLPAPLAGRWGGLLAAFAYALLAGWGVPAQRTVVMLATATLLRASGWRWPGLLVLACTGFVVTVYDPWALLQAGFWLSFVAVALLMMSDGVGIAAAPGGPGARAAWADPVAGGALTGSTGSSSGAVAPAPPGARTTMAIAGPALAWLAGALQATWRSQWVASIGLAPWTLLFFQQVSLVGLLANTWAIPLVTLLITPLALLGLAWAPLWSAGAWLIEVMMAALTVMAAWPGASWSVPVAPLWCQAAAIVGALLLVAPLPWRVRGLGAVLMLPMLMPPLPRPAEGEFELLAADVGQGNAVLVRTRGHALLYDAGPRYGRDADAGSRVLAPLLRALGVDRLDVLMLSHRDTDHTGGAALLMRQPGAWRVMSSLEIGHGLRTDSVHQPCAAGQTWEWDGVRFEVLHPAEREYRRAEQRLVSSNGLSCVLRIQGQRSAALLSGDIETEQERQLVNEQEAGRLNLGADLLLVPHHGSRTSSSQAFLDAVQPRWAVAQLGWRNRYGHPAAEVVARYHALGISWIRTDLCGAWQWSSASDATSCERERRARYWHAPTWGDGPEFAKELLSNSSSP